MTNSQTPMLQQPSGFAFDSSDFAMNSSQQYLTVALEQNTSMDEWKTDDNKTHDTDVNEVLEQ